MVQHNDQITHRLRPVERLYEHLSNQRKMCGVIEVHSLPGCQDVVDGIAQLKQLGLVAVEVV